MNESDRDDELTPIERVALFALFFWPFFFAYAVAEIVRWLK